MKCKLLEPQEKKDTGKGHRKKQDPDIRRLEHEEKIVVVGSRVYL
jgi:hypothetical protein